MKGLVCRGLTGAQIHKVLDHKVEGGGERTVIAGWMALGKDMEIVPKHLRRQRKNENHEELDIFFITSIY